MSDSMLLSVAAFVFVMMLIGLGLTVWEFRYGQPKREDQEADSGKSTPERARLLDGA